MVVSLASAGSLLVLLRLGSGLGLLVANGDGHSDLVGDFCQFAAHQIQVGVDRLLVVLVDLGQGKQRDKGQDDQSHAIEPGTHVGEDPQNDAELDRIDDILNQKQTPQLGDEAIDMCHSHAGNVLYLFVRQRQIQLQVILEGVTLVCLLHGLCHRFVDSEGDGAEEG